MRDPNHLGSSPIISDIQPFMDDIIHVPTWIYIYDYADKRFRIPNASDDRISFIAPLQHYPTTTITPNDYLGVYSILCKDVNGKGVHLCRDMSLKIREAFDIMFLRLPTLNELDKTTYTHIYIRVGITYTHHNGGSTNIRRRSIDIIVCIICTYV